MKKQLAALLTLPLIFALASCNNDSQQEEKNPPEESHFYLPSEIKYEFNGVVGNVSTFEYDSNFLGYTNTEVKYDNGTILGKEKKVVKFNTNFSKKTVENYEYHDNPLDEIDGPVWVKDTKEEYTFYKNGSYEEKDYIFDLDKNDYVFDAVYGRFYNEIGQKTSHYDLDVLEDGTLKILSMYEYQYCENGYPRFITEYDGNFEEKYASSYDEYQYNDDNSTCKIVHYVKVNGEKRYVRDGYTMVNITSDENSYYFDEQIYSEDGTPGNHNKFGFNSNHEYIYKYYGGFPDEEKITQDENGNITYFEQTYENDLTKMDVTYDELGNIKSTSKTEKLDLGTRVLNSTYSYFNNDQIQEVSCDLTDWDGEFTHLYQVTYTDLKSDKLYESIRDFDDIVRHISDNVLVEGL